MKKDEKEVECKKKKNTHTHTKKRSVQKTLIKKKTTFRS